MSENNGDGKGEAPVSRIPAEDGVPEGMVDTGEMALVFMVPADLWAKVCKRLGSKIVYEDVADLMPMCMAVQPQQMPVIQAAPTQ